MEQQPSVKELMHLIPRKRAEGFILPACDFLAYYATKPFLYLSLTPNQITVLWIAIKVMMTFLMLKGDYFLTVVALLIFQLASIIDGVDGNIARYRKHFSLNGIYLDYVGHYLCNTVLLIALGIGLFQTLKSWLVFIPVGIGVTTMLLTKAITINLGWYKPEQREMVERLIPINEISIMGEQKAGEKKGLINFVKVVVFDFLRLDNPLNLMFWGVLLNQTYFILGVYAVFLTAEMGRKMLAQYWRIYNAEKSL